LDKGRGRVLLQEDTEKTYSVKERGCEAAGQQQSIVHEVCAATCAVAVSENCKIIESASLNAKWIHSFLSLCLTTCKIPEMISVKFLVANY